MLFKKISPLHAITGIATLGLLAGVLLSWPLWNDLVRQSFPRLPLFGGAQINNDAGGVAFWSVFIQPYLTIALILSAGVFFQKKWLLALLIGWLLWLCCLDLNRLQPWVWFYLLIFAVVFLEKKENDTSTVNTLRWLLAGVYFWSGFNKITPYFAEDNFSWFCDAFAITKPFGQYPALGYLLACAEMTFAVGLLWKKMLPYYRWVVIGFHGVIILFLLKLEWNPVVIPWNMTMAATVWVLNPTPENSGERRKTGLTWSGVVAIVWLAPALNILQLWPYNLSWQLYTNLQPEATLYSDSRLSCNSLSGIWEKHAFDNSTKLLLDDWAMDELKVPMYSSDGTISKMGKYLCRCVSNPDGAGIYILRVHRWDKSAEEMKKIPCSVQQYDWRK